MDGHPHPRQDAAATAKDPVCGMDVDPVATEHRAEHEGDTFHFCSAGCREKFVTAPEHYAGPGGHGTRGSAHRTAAPAGTVHENAEYTCPMHPEVRQTGPGSCPICGMALEPVLVSAEDTGPSEELKDMTRRFWIGLVLTVPVFILEMG